MLLGRVHLVSHNGILIDRVLGSRFLPSKTETLFTVNIYNTLYSVACKNNDNNSKLSVYIFH